MPYFLYGSFRGGFELYVIISNFIWISYDCILSWTCNFDMIEGKLLLLGCFDLDYVVWIYVFCL